MTFEGVTNLSRISEVISDIDKYSEKNGLNRQRRVQLSTAVEEILLIYMEKYDDSVPFRVKVCRKNGDLNVCLRVWCEKTDPIDPGTVILNRVLGRMDNAPKWEYKSRYNQICFKFMVYSTTLKNLQLSWRYMQGQRSFFFIAVASQLISVVLSIVSPVLSARLIVYYTQSVFDQIVLIALSIFAVRLISNFVLFLANRSYNVVYNKTLSNLEEALVDSALDITKSSIDENGTGLFIQRLTSDTTQLATGFNTMADMSTTLLNYMGILCAVFIISPPVFAVVLSIIIIQGILERIRNAKVNVLDRVYRESNERFTGFISEMIKGTSDVKTLNIGRTFKAELADRINDANDKRMYMQSCSWAYRLTRMEIGAFIYLGFMCLLGFLIKDGAIEAVTAVILFNYYSQLDYSAIAAVGEFMEFIRNFNLSAERVYEILQGNRFQKEHFGDKSIENVRGEVKLSHVCFSYKSSDPTSEPVDVLKDMNLFIEAGKTVAFVGRSGSGKSTTINLISKLYETNKGKVMIDGVDIRELDQNTIRSSIALVNQKPYLFNMSIRENLRLVKPDMTEDEMVTVCKKACIHEDIMKMKDDYNTVIGEGGINISGGQCQRIAIARALLRDCRILILDEATSALDNITQTRVQEALSKIHGEKTIIVIAHRLSTVINSDLIFLIEDGRVLDSGTHEELLNKCENYRQLYRG